MSTRTGSIIGWTCAILIGAFNLFGAVMKFVPIAPGSDTEATLNKLGLTGLVQSLGILELVIAILFLIPRTSTVGFVLMVGYMGGALATNMTHGAGQVDLIPIYVIFLLLTVSAWFRNPELVSRLLKRPYPQM